MLQKQQFLLSRESNTSCTFSYRSWNEQSRWGNDKNIVFFKKSHNIPLHVRINNYGNLWKFHPEHF